MNYAVNSRQMSTASKVDPNQITNNALNKDFSTVRLRFERNVCYLQLYRPHANNTINQQLLDDCLAAPLQLATEQASVVVLEGLDDVFCFGADFKALADDPQTTPDPTAMYDLWYQLATGPFVTIAHVRGKANAGGMGFVSACDLVIADDRAEFSLSELLFGLMPACVFPFLAQRVGRQQAHALTLQTKPVNVQEAHRIGLVTQYGENSEQLRQQLLRLRRLDRTAVKRYKDYAVTHDGELKKARETALAANELVFSDPVNREKITRYVTTGQLLWQADG